ncbi:very long chain fatty acid elongase 6 isoform X2 [Lepeophtheirus salmonis]|uniref:very long chain fatty acid elongase 6 isoform X2 n=1 Tax=Lepeophtheirus salmonis TaxID=72036 RepID=UPI003AF3421F
MNHFLVKGRIQKEELPLLWKNYSEFEHSDVKDWMEQNWSRVCLLASSVYMIIIFGGQYIMSARERFEMQNVLTFWNIFLALFSLMGFSRTLPELFHVLFSSRGDGLYHSLCIPSFIEKDRVSGFWSLMFVISKVPELGDTLFIILRKQRLIFLHWYHHVTVLLYSWYSYSEYTAVARWFIVMNYLVHSLMYSYYTFKTLKFRVPRQISMTITFLQLVQMIFGCIINISTYQIKLSGKSCQVSYQNIKFSLLMYASYFFLFVKFFVDSYIIFDKRKKPQKINMIEEKNNSRDNINSYLSVENKKIS